MIELNDDSFKPIMGARLIQKEAEDQLKKEEKRPDTTESSNIQVVTQLTKKQTSRKKQ